MTDPGLLLLLLIGLACAFHEFPRWRKEWALKAQRKARASASQAFDPAAWEREQRESREKMLMQAKALPLPDGIYSVVCHNLAKPRNDPGYIEPTEAFPAEPVETIADWVGKARGLLSSNNEIGVAVVAGKGDFHQLREELVNCFPGFSDMTYSNAINRGAVKAVH